ncbi:MAG: hypothetical protein ACYCQJ_16045 [Nitrososphaerales archaeon]
MKVKIVGRMIVLGTMLVLAAACNPLASSLGVPDFVKTHFRTHWYESTVKVHAVADFQKETGSACQNAIAMAEKSQPRKGPGQKIKVTGVMKDDRLVSTKCRVEI